MTRTTLSELVKLLPVESKCSSPDLPQSDPRLQLLSFPFKIKRIWGQMSSDPHLAAQPLIYPKSTRQNLQNSQQICPKPPKSNKNTAKSNTPKCCTPPTNSIRAGDRTSQLTSRKPPRNQVTHSTCTQMKVVKNKTLSLATRLKSWRESLQSTANLRATRQPNICSNADRLPSFL